MSEPAKEETRPGFYASTVSGTRFELPDKYKIIRAIGHGAYGVVVSAENTETGQKVAIKKIPSAFNDLTDAKRILREVKLLNFFNHENLIKTTDLGKPASLDGFEDVYIVTELMETDLHRIIYSRQDLTDDHIQYFVYQMLCALKYMHSAGVIHRDLKPSNVLLNADCTLKLCDLGLARGVDDKDGELTEYVVTRWYRAPEIMLACQEYTQAIDVWAVGCIFAELLGTKPLFPGEDYIHQLKLIVGVLGSPKEEDLDFVKSSRALSFMRKQAGTAPQKWKEMFPAASDAGLDLLDKMLSFHPKKRITVDEALAHPYLESLHDPADEPKCEAEFDFSFEAAPLNKKSLQKLMFDEVSRFHPEQVEEEAKRQKDKAT
jgi:mitogen-activated protein kinase 1/3